MLNYIDIFFLTDVKLSKMTISEATLSRQISLQGDQLLTFQKTINTRTDFDQLSRLLATNLDEKDKQCLSDLREYIIKKEDSWILDVKLLNFIGALLEHRYYLIMYIIYDV